MAPSYKSKAPSPINTDLDPDLDLDTGTPGNNTCATHLYGTNSMRKEFGYRAGGEFMCVCMQSKFRTYWKELNLGVDCICDQDFPEYQGKLMILFQHHHVENQRMLNARFRQWQKKYAKKKQLFSVATLLLWVF